MLESDISSHAADPADPIACAAASLLSLGTKPERVDPETFAAMEKALRHHTMRIEEDDFGGMEMMLTTQTQMLHHLFARSVGAFAGGGDTEALRLHSTVALQSQKSCRMTVRELAQIKKAREIPERLKTQW